MKKLIIAAVLAVSFQSVATPYEISNTTELTIKASLSKSQAYELGNKIVQELKQLEGEQVYKRLHLFNDNLLIKSLKIDHGHVNVYEFSASNGSVKYMPTLLLTYSYSDAGDHH